MLFNLRYAKSFKNTNGPETSSDDLTRGPDLTARCLTPFSLPKQSLVYYGDTKEDAYGTTYTTYELC